MLFDHDVLIMNRAVVAAKLEYLERGPNGNYIPKDGLFDHIMREQHMAGNARNSGFSFSVRADKLTFRSICAHCRKEMVVVTDVRKTPMFCSETCSKRGLTQQKTFRNTCANCGESFSTSNPRAKTCGNECAKATQLVNRESAWKW